MSSYSSIPDGPETVRVKPDVVYDPYDYWDNQDPDRDKKEVRCHRCHGSGLVEVHGQETDCIDCEGYGSVLIAL